MGYSSAVGWVESQYDFTTENDKKEASDLHISCLLNAAQCALKLKDWPEAAKNCSNALKVTDLPEASRVKALFRRGVARIKMSEFDDARVDLKEACQLDPKSKEIREMYASIKEAEKAAKAPATATPAKECKKAAFDQCGGK